MVWRNLFTMSIHINCRTSIGVFILCAFMQLQAQTQSSSDTVVLRGLAPVTVLFNTNVGNATLGANYTGWSEPNEFVPDLKPEERLLIVTEGSSDSKVFRKGFALLHPDASISLPSSIWKRDIPSQEVVI